MRGTESPSPITDKRNKADIDGGIDFINSAQPARLTWVQWWGGGGVELRSQLSTRYCFFRFFQEMVKTTSHFIPSIKNNINIIIWLCS